MAIELHEDRFPGNAAAFADLQRLLKDGSTIGFTGAGVSAPQFPTWTPLLNRLLVDATARGMITDRNEINNYQSLIESDPLESANFIEEAYTKKVFRARVADIFRNPKAEITKSHEIIANLGLRGIVTLNYDNCHEVSFSKKGQHANSARGQDRAILTEWTHQKIFDSATPPILHLHGDTSDPDSMVLTKDDYYRFYSDFLAESFVQHLWIATRVLVIGFGFSDPFLTRVAERCLRNTDSDIRHFALIGNRNDDPVSPLQRRMFAKQYRLSPIFYPVQKGVEPDGSVSEDHSALNDLLAALPVASPKVEIINDGTKTVAVVSHPAPLIAKESNTALKDFRKDLFVLPNGTPLYIEPRLTRQGDKITDFAHDGDVVPVSELVSSDDSFVVTARPEFGATTLSRRLAFDLDAAGKKVLLEEANDLPNYKKKLEEIFSGKGLSPNSDAVLILDGVDFGRHEKLIKEIIGTSFFKRYILFARISLFDPGRTLPIDQLPIAFKVITLSNLVPSDVRALATQFFYTSDSDAIAASVEQIYRDLVALCIPITPANAIMYLIVLSKEGDFHPINRVQIVGRYLTEMLRKPSDAFADAFNARDKINVIAIFVSKLYEEKRSLFNESDWYAFCKQYMKDRLIHFDERGLLNDLLGNRIFVRVGYELAIKYRFFYIFFLGRFFCTHPVRLSACIQEGMYLQHEGLTEVIAELASDNTPLFLDLIEKLTAATTAFHSRYVPKTFDPFANVQWLADPNEDEKLWKPLNNLLAAGPKNPAEIDEIKRSPTGEQRAGNQNLQIQTYDELERRLVRLHIAMVEALRNSDNLDGPTKKKAVLCALEAAFCFYQVAMIFAPKIAEKAYYYWHGLVFILANKSALDTESEQEKKIAGVMHAFRRGIAEKTADEMGSKKLGEVFKILVEDPASSGLLALLNFSCLVRAKPNNWFSAAQNAVARVDRKAFYLRSMLQVALKQFSEEVNTGGERDLLKKLIATIQIKRQQKKDHPGDKHISQVIDRLEAQDYFDKATGRVESTPKLEEK